MCVRCVRICFVFIQCIIHDIVGGSTRRHAEGRHSDAKTQTPKPEHRQEGRVGKWTQHGEKLRQR